MQTWLEICLKHFRIPECTKHIIIWHLAKMRVLKLIPAPLKRASGALIKIVHPAASTELNSSHQRCVQAMFN